MRPYQIALQILRTLTRDVSVGASGEAYRSFSVEPLTCGSTNPQVRRQFSTGQRGVRETLFFPQPRSGPTAAPW